MSGLILYLMLPAAAGGFLYKKIKKAKVNNKKESNNDDITAKNIKDIKKPKKEILNRDISINLTSLGLAAAGIVYPVIGLFCIPCILYISRDIFSRAYRGLKTGNVRVDILTSFALIGSIAAGYFLASSIVCLVFLFSQKLLLKVMDQSRGQLTDVFSQIPDSVWIKINGTELKVPLKNVKSGDIIVVNGGEAIPVDGIIVSGMATIDQHLLTGESVPEEKEAGGQVFALTTVIAGRIEVKVEQGGKDTTVSKIGKILDQTSDFQSSAELRAQTLSDKTVVPTLFASGAALLLIGPSAAIGVTIAHFKNKFMMVIPISILKSFKTASEKGVLIKDGRSLDLLPMVDTIVFDKTGTLTQEQPVVKEIHICNGCTKEDILSFAAAAESRQTHPIAKAIISHAKKKEVDIPSFDESDYSAGYGITVKIDQETIKVGSHRFMQTSNISVPPDIENIQEKCNRKGHSLVIIGLNNEVIGAIELISEIRSEAAKVIKTLHQYKQIKEMYIISGDHEAPTKALAQELGIKNYFSGILPQQKAEIIKKLRSEGKFVCYVGDGINDALAMKNSNISVSLSGATTIAMDTARIVLLNQGLSQLPFIFDLSHSFQKKTDTIFKLIAAPTVISIAGIFLFGFGIIEPLVIGTAGLLAAIVSANRALPVTKSEE